jgi:hypothetical protein
MKNHLLAQGQWLWITNPETAKAIPVGPLLARSLRHAEALSSGRFLFPALLAFYLAKGEVGLDNECSRLIRQSGIFMYDGRRPARFYRDVSRQGPSKLISTQNLKHSQILWN